MSRTLLMPRATAVWLLDNTSLSFDQIADFCNLHPLEIKAIADGEAARSVKGLDPVHGGQLTREEIEKGQKDPGYKLRLSQPKVEVPEVRRYGPRYTPVSRRQDRPNAILWLLRNHPELEDAQIIRLVGTTKTTIKAIRERTHWNSKNLTPMDPVTLGLCSQSELDLALAKSDKKAQTHTPDEQSDTRLLPAEETTSTDASAASAALEEEKAPQEAEEDIDIDKVFAKLKALKKAD